MMFQVAGSSRDVGVTHTAGKKRPSKIIKSRFNKGIMRLVGSLRFLRFVGKLDVNYLLGPLSLLLLGVIRPVACPILRF